MASTSPSDVLLTAQNIFLEYPVRLYAHTDLRSSFIGAVKNPWDYLFKNPDVLPVLKGVNLELRRGDRLGLLGVNGAGKTSLCRILSGMVRPHRGEVKLHGSVEAIFDVATGILPELTGRENAYLLARLFYRTRHVPRDMVEEALKFSELGDFLDMPFKTYSRGMQARLILSLVATTPAQVLILDEVFDGADVFFKEKISQRMMQKIANSEAVVFVSHGPEQVLQLCNRVVVLHGGQLIFDGPAQEGVDFYLRNSSGVFGR